MFYAKLEILFNEIFFGKLYLFYFFREMIYFVNDVTYA
jgi:hypothetical protein